MNRFVPTDGAEVHVVVSDIHFGKDSREAERSKEDELIRCLRSFEPRVGSLTLLGDVFECYIEHRHLVPKGWIRFQGLLAEWSDGGIPITMFAGNHDPWHIDYYESELGVRVIFDELVTELDGYLTYLHHGDGLAKQTRRYNFMRPILRHPLPVWIYRNLIPGDFGMVLARYAGGKVGDDELDAGIAAEMTEFARSSMRDGVEQVVLGHTHIPELRQWPEGRYVNPGSWHVSRTVACFQDGEVDILRWNGTECEAYQGHRRAAQSLY